MSPDAFDRVQNDLSVLRASLGSELPYDWRHVLLQVLVAAGGLPLMLLPLIGLESWVRPVMLVCIGACVVGWSVLIQRTRADRAARPARWRWQKRETYGSAVAIALLVGYIIWIASLRKAAGQWGFDEAKLLSATILFFLGAGLAAWIAAMPCRWPDSGWAAALIACGVAMPLCAAHPQFLQLLGAALFFGGAISASLWRVKIRRHETQHAY